MGKNFRIIVLKIICIILIQAFLVLDFAWCGMNNHDAGIISCTTLSPTINISDNLLKTTFDSIALRPDTFNKKTKDFLSNYFLINNGSLIFANGTTITNQKTRRVSVLLGMINETLFSKDIADNKDVEWIKLQIAAYLMKTFASPEIVKVTHDESKKELAGPKKENLGSNQIVISPEKAWKLLDGSLMEDTNVQLKRLLDAWLKKDHSLFTEGTVDVDWIKRFLAEYYRISEKRIINDIAIEFKEKFNLRTLLLKGINKTKYTLISSFVHTPIIIFSSWKHFFKENKLTTFLTAIMIIFIIGEVTDINKNIFQYFYSPDVIELTQEEIEERENAVDDETEDQFHQEEEPEEEITVENVGETITIRVPRYTEQSENPYARTRNQPTQYEYSNVMIESAGYEQVPTAQEQENLIESNKDHLLNAGEWKVRFLAANELSKMMHNTGWTEQIKNIFLLAMEKETDLRVKIILVNKLRELFKKGILKKEEVALKNINILIDSLTIREMIIDETGIADKAFVEDLRGILFEDNFETLEKEIIVLSKRLIGVNIKEILWKGLKTNPERTILLFKRHFKSDISFMRVVITKIQDGSYADHLNNRLKNYLFEAIDGLASQENQGQRQIEQNITEVINHMSFHLRIEMMSEYDNWHSTVFDVFTKIFAEKDEITANIPYESFNRILLNLARHNKIEKIVSSKAYVDLEILAKHIVNLMISDKSKLAEYGRIFFVPISDIIAGNHELKWNLEDTLIESFDQSRGKAKILLGLYLAKNYDNLLAHNKTKIENVKLAIDEMLNNINAFNLNFMPMVLKGESLTVNLHYQDGRAARWHAQNTLTKLLGYKKTKYNFEKQTNLKKMSIRRNGIIYNFYIGRQRGIDKTTHIRMIRGHVDYETRVLRQYKDSSQETVNMLQGCYGLEKIPGLKKMLGQNNWFIGTSGKGIGMFNDIISIHMPVILAEYARLDSVLVEWKEVKKKLKKRVNDDLKWMQKYRPKEFKYIRNYYPDPFEALDNFKFPHEVLMDVDAVLNSLESLNETIAFDLFSQEMITAIIKNLEKKGASPKEIENIIQIFKDVNGLFSVDTKGDVIENSQIDEVRQIAEKYKIGRSFQLLYEHGLIHEKAHLVVREFIQNNPEIISDIAILIGRNFLKTFQKSFPFLNGKSIDYKVEELLAKVISNSYLRHGKHKKLSLVEGKIITYLKSKGIIGKIEMAVSREFITIQKNSADSLRSINSLQDVVEQAI